MGDAVRMWTSIGQYVETFGIMSKLALRRKCYYVETFNCDWLRFRESWVVYGECDSVFFFVVVMKKYCSFFFLKRRN